MKPVKERSNLYRDDNGAIVNTDSTGLAKYLKAKKSIQSKDDRIEKIENDIIEIKSMLKKLLEEK